MTAIFLLWSATEQNIGMMFVLLLDGNADDAFDVFHAFIDLGPKQTAIRTLAKKKLSVSLNEEIEDVLKSLRKRSGVRNAIVHGLWAVSDEFPDAVLRIDGKEFNRKFLNRMNRAKDGNTAAFADDYEYDGMVLSAYTEDDFRSNIEVLNRLSFQTQGLALKISKEIVDATRQRRFLQEQEPQPKNTA